MAPDNDPFVTPRELHEELGLLDDKLDAHAKESERRFGRLEKAVLLLIAMTAAPKFGAPAPSQAAAFVLSLLS